MLGTEQQSSMDDYMARYGQRLQMMLGQSAPPTRNLGAGSGGFGGGTPNIPVPGQTQPEYPGEGVSGQGPWEEPLASEQPMQQGGNLGATMPRAPAPMTDFNPDIANQRAHGQLPQVAQAQLPTMQKNEQGQVKIQSRPEGFDFGVKDDDLAEVKTVGDLVQKMPEKKAKEYMSWWEQQYGDINSKYDAMMAELGKRPDPKDRSLSRKDKFTLLMEFGLNLMRHSQRGGDRTGAMGAALHDTVRGDQARREKDFDLHRSLSNEIEGRRQKELGTIGTQGGAMVASQNLGASVAQEERAAETHAERDEQVSNLIYGDEGVVGVNRKGQGKTIRDESGQPVRSTLGVSRGSRGGAGGGGFAPSDVEKRAKFYSDTYEIPLDAALDIVRAEKQVDPYKMYSQIVNGQLRQYMTPEDADRVARELVEGAFGVDALSRPGDPLRHRGNLGGGASQPAQSRGGFGSNTAPPANVLKQGVVTTFSNGQKWTLDESGTPKRVFR
jgi:hypothetical protein